MRVYTGGRRAEELRVGFARGITVTAPTDLQTELAAAWADLEKAQQRFKELRRQTPPETVPDYELRGTDGVVRLSEMFGAKSDLILIHNMGAGCPYCTMWADGFNACFITWRTDRPS